MSHNSFILSSLFFFKVLFVFAALIGWVPRSCLKVDKFLLHLVCCYTPLIYFYIFQSMRFFVFFKLCDFCLVFPVSHLIVEVLNLFISPPVRQASFWPLLWIHYQVHYFIKFFFFFPPEVLSCSFICTIFLCFFICLTLCWFLYSSWNNHLSLLEGKWPFVGEEPCHSTVSALSCLSHCCACPSRAWMCAKTCQCPEGRVSPPGFRQQLLK